MSTFAIASIAGWVFSVAAAARLRGRRAAIFVSILLGIYTLVATTLVAYVGPLLPLYIYLHASV